MGDLYLLDEDWNPIPEAEQGREAGRVRFRPGLPAKQVIVSYKLDVPGFGHFVFYADEGGRGYRLKRGSTLELDLVAELAHSRLLAAERTVKPLRRADALSEETLIHVGAARSAWEAAKTLEGAERSSSMLAVLRDAGLASELAVVENARHVISRRNAPRTDFHFGAGAFLNRPDTHERNAAIERMATQISVPFYGWSGSDPAELVDFRNVDLILTWAVSAGLHVKGEPLLWMHKDNAPPDEYEGLPASWMEQFAEFRVRTIVDAFRGPVRTWHVIEEAHDWANCYGFTQDELIAITKSCVAGLRKVDRDARAIINCGQVRGEYRAPAREESPEEGQEHEQDQAPSPMTPYTYIQRCQKARVGFDAIGLKMAYRDMDLFECKRLLDRFAALRVPIHVTKFEVPSEGTTPAWHGTWSEENQAAYVEGFYTICYAHPAVREVTYWNPIDPTYPVSMGIVRDDFEPKPAYERLVSLIETWTGGHGAPGTEQ